MKAYWAVYVNRIVLVEVGAGKKGHDVDIYIVPA